MTLTFGAFRSQTVLVCLSMAISPSLSNLMLHVGTVKLPRHPCCMKLCENQVHAVNLTACAGERAGSGGGAGCARWHAADRGGGRAGCVSHVDRRRGCRAAWAPAGRADSRGRRHCSEARCCAELIVQDASLTDRACMLSLVEHCCGHPRGQQGLRRLHVSWMLHWLDVNLHFCRPGAKLLHQPDCGFGFLRLTQAGCRGAARSGPRADAGGGGGRCCAGGLRAAAAGCPCGARGSPQVMSNMLTVNANYPYLPDPILSSGAPHAGQHYTVRPRLRAAHHPQTCHRLFEAAVGG